MAEELGAAQKAEALRNAARCQCGCWCGRKKDHNDDKDGGTMSDPKDGSKAADGSDKTVITIAYG